MTRGDMRKLIQKRMGAAAIAGPIAEDINQQLNLSAQQVLIVLSKTDWINFARNTVTVTTDGLSVSFDLSISDLYRPLALIDTTGPTTDNAGRMISESERHQFWSQYESGQDEDGKWIYYFEYTPGSATPYKLVFLAPPPAMTRTLVYVTRSADIAVAPSSSNDALVYAEIPPEHHEFVVEHALSAILTHAGSPASQGAAQHLGGLAQTTAASPGTSDQGPTL